MRIARAGLATVLAVAASSCAADGGHVSLAISGAAGVEPAVERFEAANGTANHDSSDVLSLTASGGGARLAVKLQGPVSAGAELRLGLERLGELRLSVGDAAWAASGGLVECDGDDPYRVRFVGVPMRAVAGGAAGSFIVDGAGMFD